MNAVVEFKAPRLPYHPVVQERFGVDKGGWKALVEAIFPAAETPDSVLMALAYCKARGLDPFKRPVHIVPVYDSKRRCMVETVWPGISELRTTAMRTGAYAGTDSMAYGPDVTTTLDGVQVTFPEWAQLTVYKIVRGVRVPFVGPRVHWMETYATAKRDTSAPNAMWKKRPRGQLDKCAEAGALRMAFPEEIGGDYAAEEMEGRIIGLDGSPLPTAIAAPRHDTARLHAGFDEPAQTLAATFVDPVAEAEAQIEAAVPAHDADTGEIIESDLPGHADEPEDDFPGDRPSANDGFDPVQWAADAHRKALTFQHEPALKKWWNSDETKRDRAKLEASHPALLETLIGQVRAHGASLEAI